MDGADENSVVEIKTDQNWSDAIVQAMMPAYNKEERKHRCGSVKRSTG